MKMEKHMVQVLNTLTNEEETIEVSKDIYDEYRRGKWRIEKNDAKYKCHHIHFGDMTGVADEEYENFKEITNSKATPETILLQKELMEKLKNALENLDEQEKKMIYSLYYDEKSERDYAKMKGVCKNTVHVRKKKILKKLKKYF